MRKFSAGTLILIVQLAGSLIFAQGSDIRPLSLQEALEIAGSKNFDVLLAGSRVRQAQGKNTESLSGFLPSVAISENYIRSNDPVTVFSLKLKQGIFGQEDFNLPVLNSPAALDNFATSVQIKQPIFNLDAIYARSVASLGLAASQENETRMKQFAALNVTKAYYGLALAFKNSEAISAAVRSAERHRDDTQVALNQGIVTQADYLATEVRLAELREESLSARNQTLDASDHLRFLLGLETQVNLVPTDSLESPTPWHEPEHDESSLTSRHDLRALDLQLKAARRGVMMQRSGWAPRLNGFGSVEWNASEAFSKDASNWAFGFQLQWRVFEGFGIWGRSRQAAARSEEVEIRQRQATEKARLEIRQARRARATALKRIQVAESAYEQAGKALEISTARFREGLLKTSDLLDREVAQTSARLRLLRAKYDLTMATADLKFALGKTLEVTE